MMFVSGVQYLPTAILLAQVTGAGGFDPLQEARDPSPEKRKKAAEELGNLLAEGKTRDTNAVLLLIDLSNDANEKVKEAAIQAFVQIPPATIFHFAKVLGDDPRYRENAIGLLKTLEENHPDTAVSRMAGFLKEIYGSRDYNGKTNIRFQNPNISIKSYEGIPYYSLVYNVRGELVTIIHSKTEIKIEGQILEASSPAGFKVRFEDFEKSIIRNNWLLEWVHKLPPDFFRDLKALNFKSESREDRAAEYDWSSREINIFWNSTRGNGAIPHELFHYWDMGITGYMNNVEDPSSIFYGISWEKGDRGFTRRDDDLNDFRGPDVSNCVCKNCLPGPTLDLGTQSHPYGMEHIVEDLATFGQDYCVRGDELRVYAREQMMRGNFEPAIKYLFIRYVTPMADVEYQMREGSPSLEISEVKYAIESYLDSNPQGIPKTTLRARNQIVMLYRKYSSERVKRLPWPYTPPPPIEKPIVKETPPQLPPPPPKPPIGKVPSPPLPPPPPPETATAASPSSDWPITGFSSLLTLGAGTILLIIGAVKSEEYHDQINGLRDQGKIVGDEDHYRFTSPEAEMLHKGELNSLENRGHGYLIAGGITGGVGVVLGITWLFLQSGISFESAGNRPSRANPVQVRVDPHINGGVLNLGWDF